MDLISLTNTLQLGLPQILLQPESSSFSLQSVGTYSAYDKPKLDTNAKPKLTKD